MKLRDYQQKIADKILKEKPQEGILYLSTGTGKSVLANYLINKFGLFSTVLVPNTILLKQFIEEYKKWFNVKDEEIGQIGDGIKRLRPITFSTWQSLMTDKNILDLLSKQTSILVVDECQGAVSDGRLEILERFKPKYLFGLTATPMRSKDDGRTKAIEFYFGKIIADYQEKQLLPEVEVLNPRTKIPSLEYQEMIDIMIKNDDRNDYIAKTAMLEMIVGKKVLILTKRIEHYKKIYEKMPQSPGIVCVDSNNKDRNKMLTEMKNGHKRFGCLLGTFSLLGTGFDIPALDTLILAGDLKSEVLTTQSAGRILRLLKGKNPLIYDVADIDNPVFKRQFWARKRVYDEKGWNVSFR